MRRFALSVKARTRLGGRYAGVKNDPRELARRIELVRLSLRRLASDRREEESSGRV